MRCNLPSSTSGTRDLETIAAVPYPAESPKRLLRRDIQTGHDRVQPRGPAASRCPWTSSLRRRRHRPSRVSRNRGPRRHRRPFPGGALGDTGAVSLLSWPRLTSNVGSAFDEPRRCASLFSGPVAPSISAPLPERRAYRPGRLCLRLIGPVPWVSSARPCRTASRGRRRCERAGRRSDSR